VLGFPDILKWLYLFKRTPYHVSNSALTIFRRVQDTRPVLCLSDTAVQTVNLKP